MNKEDEVGYRVSSELADSPTTHATAALHRAVAIQHRVDGTFGRDGNAAEPAQQALTDFASTPAGVLVLYVQDEIFDLEPKLVGAAIGTSASIREPPACHIPDNDRRSYSRSCARCQTPCKVLNRPPSLAAASSLFVSRYGLYFAQHGMNLIQRHPISFIVVSGTGTALFSDKEATWAGNHA